MSVAGMLAGSAQQVEAAHLLEEMLRIPSISGEEAEIGAWLCSALDVMGFDVALDAAGNVVATWGEGDEVVALVGHMDTVPGTVPVRREGALLYGRGAVDAKGPLAAAIAAVRRQPVGGPCRFVIAGLVEEESTSRGAHHIAAMPAPQHLVVLEPSGTDGITIGYRGSIRLRWERAQPGAHAAGPQRSASDHAIAFAHALLEHAAAWSGEASPFHRLDIRVLNIASWSDGIEDRACADVGIRVPLGCDAAELIGAVRRAAGDASVDILAAEPPVRTDRTSALARAFVESVRETGGRPRYKLKTGTSDLNVLVPAWGCPAVAYGPGDSLLDHTPGEHVDVRDLERSVDVLDGVLRRLNGDT